MSIASAACPAIATADAIVDSSTGWSGSHREQRQRAEHLGGRRDRGRSPRSSPSRGTGRAGRATRRAPAPAATSSAIGSPFRKRRWMRAPPNGCGRKSIERTGASRRSSATCSASGEQLLAPRIRHAEHRGVDLEELDDRADDRFERHVEREALRERARDLVERPEPARRCALRRERLLELALRGAWPPRAAARSGPRRRSGRRSPRAARARRRSARCGRSGRRRAGRSRRRRPRAAARSRSRFPLRRARRRRPRGGAPSTCRAITTTPRARYGPSASSSSASAAREVRAGEPARRAGREAALVEQVDREPLGAEELAELLGRRLERVLERELLVRLPDDGEQRARLHELCLEPAGPPARPERVCRARREVAELLDELGARDQLGREHELEQAERRLAELLRDRPARAELQDADRRARRRSLSAAPTAASSSALPSGRSRQSATRSAPESSSARRRTCVELCAVSAPAASASAATRSGDSGPPSSRSSSAEGARGEADLRRDEPGGGAGALVEVAGEPEQLDAALHLVRRRRRARRARSPPPGARPGGPAAPAPRRARPRRRAARRAAGARPRARPRAPPRGLRRRARPGRAARRRGSARGRRRPP